jgi:DinB family protein
MLPGHEPRKGAIFLDNEGEGKEDLEPNRGVSPGDTMPSMFDAETRQTFHRRIERLTPEVPARWGRMSAHKMVCHLGDQLRLGLGAIPARPIPGLLRHAPVKQLVIDVLPWPHGAKSPPESFTTAPSEWQADVVRLRELLEQFGARASDQRWPDHPLFGRMSGALWGRLTCRHFDHHLRQFGV